MADGKILQRYQPYSPATPSDYPGVAPTINAEALDSAAAMINLKNAFAVYVDASVGSDVTGTGAELRPYQTLPFALSQIAAAPVGDYVVILAPGSYGNGGLDITWPTQLNKNVSMMGVGAVSLTDNINFTSVALDNNQVLFTGVGIGGGKQFVFDLALASVATIILSNGTFAVDRVDTLGPGPQVVRIFNALLTSLSTASTMIVVNAQWIGGPPNVIAATGNMLIQGSLAAAMTYNVAAGGQLLLDGCISSFSTFNIDGTMTQLSCVPPAATIAGAGSLITDASSLAFGTTVTIASTTLADASQNVGYSPATPAYWPLGAPSQVKQALDQLRADTLPTEYVYQPGGTASGNTFTNWAGLYASLSAQTGPKTVYFDDSFVSPAVIPAGAYVLDEVTFDAAIRGKITNVQVANGVTWTGVRVINNLAMDFQTTAFVETLPAVGMSFEGSAITSNGTGAIWSVPAGAQFQLNKGSSFAGVGGISAVVDIATGQSLQLVLASVSSVDANSISSPAADPTVNLIVLRPDETGGFTAQGAQFGGTTIDSPLQNAQYLQYVPANPGDWAPVPAQVAEALDQLAAAIAVGAAPLSAVLTAGNNGGGTDIVNVPVLRDSLTDASVDVQNRNLQDTAGAQSIDWENRKALETDGVTTAIDWSVPGKVTIPGVLDPLQLLLSGPDKKLGATDAGPIYMAPQTDQAAAVGFRAADGVTSILDVDTNTPKVNLRAETDAHSNAITNLPAPVAASDAATKAYVDAATSGAVETTFIFQDGGVSSQNVYATWAALYAALSTVAGPKIVQIDDSITSPCVIPAGTYDMSDTTLAGPAGVFSATPRLSLANGCVLDNLAGVSGALGVESQSASPVLSYTTGQRKFEVTNLAYIKGVIAGVPVIDISGTAIIGILLRDLASLGLKSINVTGTGQAQILLFNQSTIQTDALESDATGTITVGYDATSQYSATQTAWANPQPFSRLDDGERVQYNASTPANWPTPAPTQIRAALDTIASQVSSINTKLVYVDVVRGSDVTGTGSELRPFASITAAIAYVIGAGAGAYTLMLAPGSYTEAPLAIPGNVSFQGAVGSTTINIAMSYTAPAADNAAMSFFGVALAQTLVIDCTAAASGVFLFDYCSVDIQRTDTNPSVFLNVFDSGVAGLDISGAATVRDSLLTGNVTVQAASSLLIQSSTIAAGAYNVIGTITLLNTNALVNVAGAGSAYYDAASKELTSLSGGSITAATQTLLDRADGIGYTPTTPADWSVAPTTAQEALDNLAATRLPLDGSKAMTGALDMGTHLINNVVDPVAAQDAATKNYVDNHSLPKKATFTLSAGDITNQYIDLVDVAVTDSILFLWNAGQPPFETDDYTVSYTGGVGGKTRINFVVGGVLNTFAAAGQKVQINFLVQV